MWDDFDAYLLAAWRTQHTDCPGDVAQKGYFGAQGITDREEFDHAIGDIVGDSVSDAMEALAGSYFTNIDTWMYYDGDSSSYPFYAAAELIKKGLVPYTDGASWYLCSGESCEIVYQIIEDELMQD